MSKLNNWIGKSVSWLTTLLVLLVCYNVFIRYFLDHTTVWLKELEWHLFAVIFLLAAGYTLRDDKHVRVDLFYQNWSEKTKAWVNIIGHVFLLFPWCILGVLTSLRYGEYSLRLWERSQDPSGLPGRFVIKFIITIGFFLLMWEGVVSLIEHIKTIRSSKKNDPSWK